LLNRDRPVGNKVTSTKCQSKVSYVQTQCIIALVSDAQKAKFLLRLNHDFHAIIGKHIATPRHLSC